MKTYATKEAQNNFAALLDDVQHETIQLTCNGRRIAIVMNQERADKLIDLERKDAQLQMFRALEQLQKKSENRPRPTRAELQDLLECDGDEIEALFDEDFFQPEQ